MEEHSAPPIRRSIFGPALVGGLAGSLLTLGLLYAAIPQISGTIVRSGLMQDPQILPDTVEALRNAQFSPVLEKHRAAIEAPFASSWKGAAKPDVTLVEFYDYACGYCKASNPVLDRLLAEDKGLRIVFRELPILGTESVAAARLSLAASKVGRFAQFHDALWSAGKPSPETIAVAAAASGIPPGPINDPQIESELQGNLDLAGKLGATGTPVFVVGEKVLNGAVGYDALKAAIAEARAKKTAS